jgi:hypothetical protein
MCKRVTQLSKSFLSLNTTKQRNSHQKLVPYVIKESKLFHKIQLNRLQIRVLFRYLIHLNSLLSSLVPALRF